MKLFGQFGYYAITKPVSSHDQKITTMNTTYYWKRGFFKSTNKIFNESNLAGWIKLKFWSQSADAEWELNRYFFKSVGFFRNQVFIYDFQKNADIGQITFSNWKEQATITLRDKVYALKRISIWKSTYVLTTPEGEFIEYKGKFLGGAINTPINDGALILAGLYVIINYERKRSQRSA